MQSFYEMPHSTATLSLDLSGNNPLFEENGEEFSFLEAFAMDSMQKTHLEHAEETAGAASLKHKLAEFISHAGNGRRDTKIFPDGGDADHLNGDTGWWDDEWYFDIDPFGGDNDPFGYSIEDPSVRVEIIGERINLSLDDWWSFDSILLLVNQPGLYSGSSGGPQDMPPCPGAGNRVDWSFINELEGNRTNGYMPTRSDGSLIGKGGVTIAAGYDLGVHSLADLNKMNLAPSLVATLTPYLGLTQGAAQAYLADHPLTISSADATAINSSIHSLTVASVVAQYDNATKAGTFWELDGAAQTVILSVAFQYGNLASRTPNFWHQVTHNMWNDAVANLRHFGDDHSTRRNLEANLLAGKLTNGQLPPCH